MKIAAYLYKDQPGVGVVSQDLQTIQAYDLPADLRALGALSIVEIMAQGKSLPALMEGIPMSAVQVVAPLPKPRRNVFCVGKNYFEHAKEFAGSGFDSSAKSGGAVPEYPIIFTKVPESVIGPGASVHMPPAHISTAIDYEAELGVIIGQGGKGIVAKDAMAHVWGYTIINDVTARDWQSRHQQWHMGKSFDTFCPMGPWLVSADELDGTKTQLRCYVNGKERQNVSTANMIFDIPKIIETLSAGITLYPGDVIATGTPVGVGVGFKPPKYLKAGDVVRVEIDGIGYLENPVR